MRALALRRTRSTAALALTGLAVATGVALSAPPDALPTSSSKLPDKPVTMAYTRLDAKGRPAGNVKWRVTKAGGNCCEVLLAATRTGRLVEFGGTYPAYSDDQGKSWTEVAPTTPSTSRLPNPGPRKLGGGEGTVVMAPGGDIVGVGWDAYSGDRLQSFMYDAKAKKWYYHEAPLHEPFYDREWMAVAKGPFTIAGQTVPWISMVLSNSNRKIILISLDGLHYVVPSKADIDAIRGGSESRFLEGPADPDFDYMQEHSETRLTPIPGGGALSLNAAGNATCAQQILRLDGSWACFELPDSSIDGVLHVDSRAWLHDVKVEADEVTYRISKDGGISWASSTFNVPDGASVESWDYKAHGKLGLSAIGVHALKEDGNHQDYVLRVDTRRGVAKHVDTLLVGKGDMAFTSGLDVVGLVTGAKSNRFDFATVAILPDGKIAVGFVDKTYDDPATAILI